MLGVVRVSYRAFLFPAPRWEAGAAPQGARAVEWGAADGTPVRALLYPAAGGGVTMVHFHGNRETMESMAPLAGELHRRGIGVLLVEYRGYGASPGAPSEEGLYQDAAAALDGLAAEGVPAARVVLWGTSLGTGVAAEMAARGRGGALILVSPYTSIPRMVKRFAPFVPEGIIPDRFATLEKAGAVRVPTLVIHGDQDELIPYAMGQEVAGAIRGAELLTVAGAGHNVLFALGRNSLIEVLTAHARRAGGE